MADTPDKPETPVAKPAPRRRAPRKATTPKPAGGSNPGPVARIERSAEQAAESVGKAATTTQRRVTRTVKSAVDGATQQAAATAKAVKPRSTTRSASAPIPKGRGRKAAPELPARTPEKTGRRWSLAAIAGGLAAAGTAAALLTLRGSTVGRASAPRPADPVDQTRGAHQPDGTDSSKSFAAGIADESTIPEA